MRQKYRIYVLGEVPSDLRERVAEIHASAILKSETQDVAAKIRVSRRNGVSGYGSRVSQRKPEQSTIQLGMR